MAYTARLATLVGVACIAISQPLTMSLDAQAKKSARPASQKPAFKRTTYTTADGRERITVMSSTELEISTGDENIICKYSREDDVIRAVMTAFGTSRAVYYTVTPDGLRDKHGKIFYSAGALDRVRREAEDAEAVKARSKRPTRTIMEAQAWKWAHDSDEIYYLTLTDVNLQYRSSRGNSGGLDFAEINRIDLRKCDPATVHPCEVRVQYNDYYTNFAFSFVDDRKRREFVSAADTAVRAWKARFSTVWQRRYRGVQDSDPAAEAASAPLRQPASGAASSDAVDISRSAGQLAPATIVGEWTGREEYTGHRLLLMANHTCKYTTTRDSYNGTVDIGREVDQDGLAKILRQRHFANIANSGIAFAVYNNRLDLTLNVGNNQDKMTFVLYKIGEKLYAWGGGDAYFEKKE